MQNHAHPLFDSVVLAGGFGSRMSPLTDTLPKPLLPINGEAAFCRLLSALRGCGFLSTAVTTMYLAEAVESCSDPMPGATLEFFRETCPRGSAGAVADFLHRLEDTVLVVSGDAVCDFDFCALKKEFLKSKAVAAVLLSRSCRVQEYGSAVTQNGFVADFCEKPSARDIRSDLVSTGIYFLKKQALELIPKNTFFDFGKDLFPLLLQKGLPILGPVAEGSWFDIGTLDAYFDCNMHYSNQKNCVGKALRLHPEAQVEKSILFDGVQVGRSVIKGSILAKNVVVEDDCTVLPGCVLGEGTILKKGTWLDSKTVLKPFSAVEPKSTQSGLFAADCGPRYDDDGLLLCLDSPLLKKLGSALALCSTVVVGCDKSSLSELKSEELALGLRDCGGSCVLYRDCPPALISFAAHSSGAGAGVHLTADKNGVSLRFFDMDGLPFCREKLRDLCRRCRESVTPSAKKGTLVHGSVSRLTSSYCRMLKQRLPQLSEIKLGALCGSEKSFFADVASRLKLARGGGEDMFFISSDGTLCSALTAEGREVSRWHLFVLSCLLDRQKKVFLPRYAPVCVERLLKNHGAEPVFFGDGDSRERRSSAVQSELWDGLYLCLKVLCLLQNHRLSLDSAFCLLPSFAVTSLTLPYEQERIPSLLSKLQKEKERLSGFEFSQGRVSILPCACGGIKLFSEAVNYEMAEEFVVEAISRLLN